MILSVETFILFFSFYLLGKSADLVVENIKRISQTLGFSLAVLGIILGFFTTLPELGVGINALIFNYGNLSLGNLLGGLPVIFCLVLGLSAVLNRKIITEGDFKKVLPGLFYIFLPFILLLNGRLGFLEGVLLVVFYFLATLFLYRNNHAAPGFRIAVTDKSKLIKEIKYIILGVLGVLILSDIIVRLMIGILKDYPLPPFLIGALVFSIGTNLPEIIIAVQSWKKHAAELSVNHLLGSSMANILLVGFFASLKPFIRAVDVNFLFLAFFVLFVLILFVVFYRTKKILSAAEGYILLFLYIIFFLIQSWLLRNYV